MVSVIRFLNNHLVSQQKPFSIFLVSFMLAACARSSGGGSIASDDALSCFPDKATLSETSSLQDEVQEAFSTTPDINLDPHYNSFIVEFAEPDSNKGLEPSGNPVREYTVEGIFLSQIRERTYSMDLSQVVAREEAVEKLAQRRKIKFIEPDYPIHRTDDFEQSEPTESESESDLIQWDEASRISEQWALTNIQSSQAWTITRGSEELVVAVVDSGIDYTHKDLKNNIWSNPKETVNGKDDDGNGYVDDIRGWNYVNNNNSPKTTSKSNHGTHVAGIIGAAGSVVGLSQKVSLMPLRFINEAGTGITSHAIRAIDYATQKKVFAINNSWGSSNKSRALQDALTRAERAGILVVVASGNGENGKGYNISSRPYYPASYMHTNIIRVAATKTNNLLTAFSNYSRSLVDVAAPGSSILSTVTGNKYMKMSGTSMATPLVTGLAVLVKAANQNLTAVQIRGIINTSVDVIPGLKRLIRTGGRINARKAVQMAAQVDSDFTPPTCP